MKVSGVSVLYFIDFYCMTKNSLNILKIYSILQKKESYIRLEPHEVE